MPVMSKGNLFRQRLLVDTIVVNVFFFLVNFANETLIARMPLVVSLRLRAVALITNTLTARPYGLWRDFLWRRLAPIDALSCYVADTLVFFTFQLPLYWVNMVIAGNIKLHQVVVASITIGLMAGFLGRPCGIFLNWARRVCEETRKQGDCA